MQHCYAFFDFDGTLIRGDSIVRFCLFAFRRRWTGICGLLRAGAMGALYALRLISAERSKRGALAFLKGRNEKEVRALAGDFCQSELIPRLYPEALREIAAQRARGARVWLVSASTAFYLEPLKEALGLDELVGTRMHVENGVYSGLLDGHNCRGVEKTLRIAEVLAARGEDVDYAGSAAYGDSAGDAPMLMLCADKVAVNPSKKLIKAVPGARVARWGKEASGEEKKHV